MNLQRGLPGDGVLLHLTDLQGVSRKHASGIPFKKKLTLLGEVKEGKTQCKTKSGKQGSSCTQGSNPYLRH